MCSIGCAYASDHSICIVFLLLLIWQVHNGDAFSVELQAVKRAIEIAVQLGIVRLIIETDVLLVEQALNRRQTDFSWAAQVIEDGHCRQWGSGMEIEIKCPTWLSNTRMHGGFEWYLRCPSCVFNTCSWSSFYVLHGLITYLHNSTKTRRYSKPMMWRKQWH